MVRKCVIALLGGCLGVLLFAAIGGCKRQANTEADDEINRQKLIETNPNAPVIIFPEQFKTDDVTVNEFIRTTLEACRTGDYDQFRQCFGVTIQPPSDNQFSHVWQSVKEIRVANKVITRRELAAIAAAKLGKPLPPAAPEVGGRHEPQEYYVHVVVQLRRPDRRERTERQAVVSVFKEGDRWRMAPAEGAIQGLILYPTTQPTTGPATATRPSRRHAATRPSNATTAPAR
jgi:hypothetical protein